MISIIKTFFASVVVLGIIDYIWLGLIIKKFNNEQLALIARMSEGEVSPQKIPAIFAYIVMALAMTVFVGPRLNEGTLVTSALWGAALGFVIYAIYDLTNLAVIKDYPIPFALVDMAWGTTLYALSAAILFLIRDWLA